MLVNAGGSVLESFPERLRKHALKRLVKLGVEVRLGELVESVEDGIVRFRDGTSIGATTVVWAAGVRACDLAGTLGAAVAGGGRVRVTPQLNLESHPDVFVVGDMAHLDGCRGGGAYPMVAQVAIQQGRLAAENITALEQERALSAFRYHDKGQMAIIGRRSAVVDAFGIRLAGLPARIGWLGLHLVYLSGLRNRLVVLMDWIAAYVSPTRGAGVITRPAMRRIEPLEAEREAA